MKLIPKWGCAMFGMSPRLPGLFASCTKNLLAFSTARPHSPATRSPSDRGFLIAHASCLKIMPLVYKLTVRCAAMKRNAGLTALPRPVPSCSAIPAANRDAENQVVNALTSCFTTSPDVIKAEVTSNSSARPSMQTAIWSELDDVEAALARLEVPLELLQEAVQAGYLGRISRTANDAPNAAGFYQWNDTLRSLRENMARRNWQRNDNGNWPTTVHSEKLRAIAVSSGNQDTGNAKATPSTKTAKGPRTAKAVSVNANQPWLPGFEPVQYDEAQEPNHPTWLLLFFADEKELRAELSLPVTMDCDGHVSAWRERIILPALSLGPIVTMPAPDFGPDVDIKIARKK